MGMVNGRNGVFWPNLAGERTIKVRAPAQKTARPADAGKGTG